MFQPLGQWTQSHSKRRIQCIAYQYDSTLAVQTEGDQYIKCRQHRGREYRDDQNCSLHYDDIPEHANPVLVILHKDTTWRVSHATQSLRTPTPFTYGTFAEFIATLEPPWEIDLLQHHELQVDPYTLCLEIQPQQFFAGSDGSKKYGVRGAFGWSISTVYGKRVAITCLRPRGLVETIGRLYHRHRTVRFYHHGSSVGPCRSSISFVGYSGSTLIRFWFFSLLET